MDLPNLVSRPHAGRTKVHHCKTVNYAPRPRIQAPETSRRVSQSGLALDHESHTVTDIKQRHVDALVLGNFGVKLLECFGITHIADAYCRIRDRAAPERIVDEQKSF